MTVIRGSLAVAKRSARELNVAYFELVLRVVVVTAFFAGFLRLAHRIYIAAGVVGFCCRGTRLEVREHLRVGALCPGCPIEFSQRRVVSEQRL